jgi:predicted acylesterase/phospholipase RssA
MIQTPTSAQETSFESRLVTGTDLGSGMALTTLRQPHTKALLALDGGGIRGLFSLQILKRIEELARKHAKNPDLRLCDCFDFIAGTSTGGMIAASLSLGLSVVEIEHFYLENAAAIFTRNSSLIKRLTTSRYESTALRQALQDVYGVDTTLGSNRLRTLLMLVMLNASTSSPWPLTNNPKSRYNDFDLCGDSSNLRLPLWQLVRASAAAPFYFEPEAIEIEGQKFLFFDGGLTPYNNPAFKLFQTAALSTYRLNWPVGSDRMMLVSVGTGLLPRDLVSETVDTVNFIKAVPAAAHALMYTSSVEQDLMCRSFGRVVAGDQIDSEVGDLSDSPAIGQQPMFTYARYNADLSKQALAQFGLAYDQNVTFSLDCLDSIDACIEVGRKVAREIVKLEHFDGFWAKT